MATAVGFVAIFMQSNLSPEEDLPLIFMDTAAKDGGKAADKAMSTGTLTAPAAIGHFKPVQVKDPVPRGKGKLLELHKSPV